MTDTVVMSWQQYVLIVLRVGQREILHHIQGEINGLGNAVSSFAKMIQKIVVNWITSCRPTEEEPLSEIDHDNKDAKPANSTRNCNKPPSRALGFFFSSSFSFFFRKERRLLFRKRKQPLIFKLPNELLFRIQSLLPLTSQACLALTCKTFLELFRSVLSDKEFRFPYITCQYYYYYGQDEPGSWKLRSSNSTPARRKLLHQIESDGHRRWLYCSNCLKLHPTREFPTYDQQRKYCYNSAIMRSCMSFAGIVELCPCIQLTFRESRRLIEDLKKKKKEEDSNSNCHKSSSDSDRDRDTGRRQIWHGCSRIGDGYSVRIQIVPLLKYNKLLIETQYEIDVHVVDNKRGWLSEILPHFSSCPYHYSPLYLQDDWACSGCLTSIKKRYRGIPKSDHYSILVTRNLGDQEGREASLAWLQQSSLAYRLSH